MKPLLFMSLLLACFSLAFGDNAAISFAAVDSIAQNRSVLKVGYGITVRQASKLSAFLIDGKLIPSADEMYVLVDVPLLGAKGSKLDSLKTFMTKGQEYNGCVVYVTGEGSIVPGRLYMRYDNAIKFLKDMAGGK